MAGLLYPSLLLLSDCFCSEDDIPVGTSSADFHKLSYIHMSHNLGPICGPYHSGGKVENEVEERDNRGATHGKTVFKEMIQFCLMFLPSGSLCSNLKGYAHITGRKY